MIGIASAAYVIPPDRLENSERAEKLGISASTLEKIGIRRVARKSPDQDTSDLCLMAARHLLEQSSVSTARIDCLVVVTQNPSGHGLPHTSALVHHELGLREQCLTFDISLGCSGYVAGLAILRDLMTAQGMRHGLLLTADPYSKIVNECDRNTALLFGDAATATHLTSEDPVWRIGQFDFGTQSSHRTALQVSADGHLSMNGQTVFVFAAACVPPSIARVVERNDFTLEQVDRFVLHQGSLGIVEAIGDRLRAGKRPEFYAADYGNTISSAIPIAFVDGVTPEDRVVVLSGFGVGLCWASTVLERIQR
ncbi:MAG: ketoacyl-ACP synthase III [Terriglobia bacterium]